MRIARSDTIENAYDARSATNGSARPSPKSAPPADGPTSVTVANRACSAAAASGSCAAGTTERSAPTSAMLKKTKAVPSTNATIAICAKVTSVERERDDEAADRGDADRVGGEHQHAPVPAVDGDAGEEREERVREDAREPDDAGAAPASA